MFRHVLDYIHEKLGICSFCHIRKSVWSYMPGSENACDECVPRGCGCNRYPKDGDCDNYEDGNWVEETDENGRKYPCCEWMKIGD